MRPEQMDVPHFLYPELFEWLFDDQVLNLVESLIGPDIALYSSHFLCKPPGDGKRVPWHEDSAYWRGTFPEDQMEVCTLWLAIDDSDEGNGAMQIIPGTHLGKGGYSDYIPVSDPDRSAFHQEIRPQLYDAKRAVTCSLRAGQASLHHAKLMHGSPLNTSNRRRCGYTMRYISTRCHFNHELRGKGHQMYLARGVDHAGNRYGDPCKPAHDLLEGRGSLFRAGH
jgi:ectoine hydroxylase-related dioxygenase (phytanoyl-CoA dioxygenase family)